jgi:hypothetical protein
MLDCFLCPFDFLAEPSPEQEVGPPGVMEGMIGDSVSAGGYFPYKFGLRSDIFPDAEKGCTNPVLLEDIEKQRSAEGVRPVIKGKRHLHLSQFSTTDSGPEKLELDKGHP